MGFMYLGFENGTFFRSDLCKDQYREPVYQALACNYYVYEVKWKKSNRSQLFDSWFSFVVNMALNKWEILCSFMSFY